MRRFERQGVEVTTQVQTAARKVAHENALLRALLAAHGVQSNEIDEYLRSQKIASDAVPFSQKPNMLGSKVNAESNISIAHTKEPPAPVACNLSKCGSSSQNTVIAASSEANHNKDYVMSQLADIDDGPSVSRKSTCCAKITEFCAKIDPKIGQTAIPIAVPKVVHIDSKTSKMTAIEAVPRPCMPSTTELLNSNVSMDDESSCEAAASIIASMRGHGDSEAVMAELGCSSNRTCNIKNMTIFELLDG